MSTTETSRGRRRSLAEVAAAIESADNPAQAALDLTLERLRERDPELAACVRPGAIPRELDAELLGVLRGKPEDRVENELLLQRLLALSFVSPTLRGGCRYHDATRQWILEEWRSDPARKEEFDKLNETLARFFEDRHRQARELEQDLERVKELLLRTDSPRFVQLFSSIEQRLLAPLLEGIYQKSLISVEAAFIFFRDRYQEAESWNRYSLCQSLLETARQVLGQLPTSAEQVGRLKWLRYYEARIVRQMGQLERAEELLQALRDESSDDATLQLWVLGELGIAFEAQFKLREARDSYSGQLKFKAEDPYNLPVWHIRLANVHWTLGELTEAEGQYRKAIGAAQEKNIQRVDMEAYARLSLGNVLFENGEWERAFDLALEALYLARTELPRDRNLAQSIVGQLMPLIARRDSALLDALHCEALDLLGAMENSPQELSLTRQYLDLLRESGRLNKADQLLADLKERSADTSETYNFTDLLLAEALLHEEHGQLEAAMTVYQTIVERAEAGRAATPWHRGAALSNQGLGLANLSRLNEAEAVLEPVIGRWKEIGAEKLAAFVQTFLVKALRRHGEPTRAETVLKEAAAVLREGPVSYRAEVEFTQAELALAQTHWEQVREHHLAAIKLNTSIDQHNPAARSHSQLATAASRQGRWAEAAEHAAEASKLWQRLAARDRFTPSPTLERAASSNARGVQRFTEYSTSRFEQNKEAADLFRQASVEAPDQFWYSVNLAFACAASSDWTGAIAALENACARAPAWARSNVFLEWLAAFHLRKGEGLAAQGQTHGAAEAFTRSRELLQQAHRPNRVSAHRVSQLRLGLGDGFFGLGHFDEALFQYRAGLPEIEEGTHLSLRASLHARLALRAAAQADLSEAAEQYRLSLEDRRADGIANPGASLVDDCAQLADSWPAFHSLASFLRDCAAAPAPSPEERREMRAAGIKLSRTKYRRLLRGPEADGGSAAAQLPVVTPIILEADAGFLPENDTALVEQLINEEAPAMRDRLLKTLGLKVPGVRLRSSAGLGEGVYILMLDEIPLVAGSVKLGQRFCPDAARCRALGIPVSETRKRSDSTEGAWLPAESWAAAEAAGLPLWDPFHFVFQELATLIQRNAASFFGVQELEELLDTWMLESKDVALRDRALPDLAARIRFLQMLRALLEEEVSIAGLSTLLSIFAEQNPRCSELGEIVEHARRALRAELPGNEPGRTPVALSPAFEAEVARWVHTLDGRSFLAMPPETAQTLFADFRTVCDGGVNQVVVVRDARLRPFVRRLLVIEFPLVPVLSWPERLEDAVTPALEVQFSPAPAETVSPPVG